MSQDLIHWADTTADRIIRQKGDKETYVLACGITPSGTVHFGNFRETMTVDLVARGLIKRGKKVRFIFSWDDYDTFRKVPKNMPKQDLLQQYLYQPIVDTPDTFEKNDSYARHNEVIFENEIKKLGIGVNFLYQAKKYRAGDYRDLIRKSLKEKDKIIAILNAHRTEPLSTGWLPVSIYCEKCNRDRMKDITYDGADTLTYACELCGHKGKENLQTTSRVKLPWRMDWPMRWSFEKVDFEPGGKDHSSQGGSYTTAKEIAVEVFGFEPPVYLQYDFISIKGCGGKMSSSSGEVITVTDVLKVYEPEMVRWIFASYKTNVDFAISFDLDVLKAYEDYDRMERLAFGVEPGNEKKVEMAKRVYELCQIGDATQGIPLQPSFRHLCNILQINGGDIDKAAPFYASQMKNERDERRFRERSERALFWLENYAPEDFKFKLNSQKREVELTLAQGTFLDGLKATLKNDWASFKTDKDLHEKIYALLTANGLSPEDVFPLMYQLLISKDQGPKLAGFIRIIGAEKTLQLI